jgi:hypothetical protein
VRYGVESRCAGIVNVTLANSSMAVNEGIRHPGRKEKEEDEE